MTAREVADIIEEFAPLDNQEPWDNSGFCIGSPQTEVHGVLVGFDCTLELVQEAVEVGANMIITHHPLIFQGLKKINEETFLGAIITLAIRSGIVIYAAHTNADKVMEGVSGLMADRLGLGMREPLDEGGLGIIGNLSEPLSSEEFIALVKKEFSLPSVRSSKPLKTPISRVAMCGGSGASLIENAIAKGADAYLCGDISYHHFFTEKGFMLLDVGHYESEIDIVDKIIAVLKEKIHTFAILKTRNHNNPIFYY